MNPYLDGLKPAPVASKHSPRKTLALWVLLIVMFIAIYNFVGSSPHSNHATPDSDKTAVTLTESNVPFPFVTILGSVVLLLLYGLFRQGSKIDSDLNDAEIALQSDDVNGAIERIRVVLANKVKLRARALYLLGECAERRGDFVEAEEVFREALAACGEGNKKTGARGTIASLVLPRQAFALIAVNRLDEGALILDARTAPDEHPNARALALRARALLLAKRRDTEGFRALISANFATIQNALAVRDRLLLRAIELTTNGTRQGALAGAIDPDERAWITRIAPETTVAVEAA